MNILISQSQGETFAALSLQRPLLNTLAHTLSKVNLLALVPAHCRLLCFSIPVVTHLCECFQVHTKEDNVCAFTQGERGIE